MKALENVNKRMNFGIWICRLVFERRKSNSKSNSTPSAYFTAWLVQKRKKNITLTQKQSYVLRNGYKLFTFSAGRLHTVLFSLQTVHFFLINSDLQIEPNWYEPNHININNALVFASTTVTCFVHLSIYNGISGLFQYLHCINL